MEYRYKPSRVCSSKMIFNIDDKNIIQDLKAVGGCNGNLNGISKLLKEMHIDDVIKRLSGITCGYKKTSFPDQISKVLAKYKKL